MVDMYKSVEIYNHLMNGRIINRERLGSHGEFESEALFSEIMDNLGDYKNQYAISGFSLIANADYVYIIKGQAHDMAKTDIAMKAYCLLLLLGKYITSHNYRLEKLSVANGGLSLAEFNKIQAMPETKEILERANMGEDLFKSIKSILVERHIMYVHPITQNYLLSNSGKAFFEELMADFSAEIELS